MIMGAEAFCGFPGQGKSFALTHLAYKSLKIGRPVFTSFSVKGTYKITFDDLKECAFPEGAHIIIDESGRWFNSRKWSDLPDNVFDLFTLRRHMGYDLSVAVQDFNRIDKSLREVIEVVWWASNHWWSPFFIYDGYYSVEKLGSKGEADLKKYISKFSKSRHLYDTHAMKELLKGKKQIELRYWVEPESDAGAPEGKRSFLGLPFGKRT